MCRSLTAVVVGKTLVSNRTGEKLLVVVQGYNKRPINTKKYFVYRQNPVISDIYPLSHLLRYAEPCRVYTCCESA